MLWNSSYLQVGSSHGLSAASGVYTDGSGDILDLGGYDSTVAYLSGGGSGDTVILGANKLTIAYNGSTPQTSAIILTGTGGVIKTVPAPKSLGVYTYTGPTTVSGGVLAYVAVRAQRFLHIERHHR